MKKPAQIETRNIRIDEIETRNIRIDEIEVSKYNPRFVQTVIDETAAIHQLIMLDYQKMIFLVNSIIEDGWHNCFFIFLKNKSDLILMDGNRRLTALKILMNPLLIPEGKNFESLRVLCKGYNKESLDKLTFFAEIWHEDSEALYKRIERLHLSDASKSLWTPMARYRFSLKLESEINKWIKTFIYYIGDDKTIDNILTNTVDVFRRILTGGNNKIILQIDEKGKINIPSDDLIFNEIVKYGTTTSNITRKKSSEIEDDLLKIIKNISNGDKAKQEDHYILEKNDEKESNPKNPRGNANNQFEKKRSKRRNSTKGGLYIFPKAIPFNQIKYTKLIDLLEEAKDLNIMEYPFTSAILFRTILELTCKNYIAQNPPMHENELPQMFSCVNNDLRKKGLISDSEHKLFSSIINKENFVTLLNNKVHDLIDSLPNRIDFADSSRKLVNFIMKIL